MAPRFVLDDDGNPLQWVATKSDITCTDVRLVADEGGRVHRLHCLNVCGAVFSSIDKGKNQSKHEKICIVRNTNTRPRTDAFYTNGTGKPRSRGIMQDDGSIRFHCRYGCKWIGRKDLEASHASSGRCRKDLEDIQCICGKTTKVKADLDKHRTYLTACKLKLIDWTTDQPFPEAIQCLCGTQEPTWAKLVSHVAFCQQYKTELKLYAESNKVDEQLQCICGRRFVSKDGLQVHRNYGWKDANGLTGPPQCRLRAIPLNATEILRGAQPQCICGSSYSSWNDVLDHAAQCESYKNALTAFDAALSLKRGYKTLKDSDAAASDMAPLSKKPRTDLSLLPSVQYILIKTLGPDVENATYWSVPLTEHQLKVVGEICENSDDSDGAVGFDFYRHWRLSTYDSILEQSIEARNKTWVEVKAIESQLPTVDRHCIGASGNVCPYHATLSIRNTLLVLHGGDLVLRPRCFLCDRAYNRARRAANKQRRDLDGNLLCVKCLVEPRVEGIFHCEKHRKHDAMLGLEVRQLFTNIQEQIDNRQALLQYLDLSTVKKRTKEWRRLIKAHVGNRLYFVDCEFIREIPSHIAVLDTQGNILINAVIDYGKTADELLNELEDVAKWRKREEYFVRLQDGADKYYGVNVDAKIKALDHVEPEIVAERLAALGTDNIFAEWSLNYCDIDRINRFVSKYSQRPPPTRANAVRAITILQKEFDLLGRTSLSLSTIHSLLWPDQRLEAHLAHNDAYMMWEVMQYFFERFN